MNRLRDIQEFYAQYLEGRIFRFCTKTRNVDVVFYRESLCHLLGMQHITPSKNYLGLRGYENIVSGKITTEKLKAVNKEEFDRIKPRIRFFKEIPDILESGALYNFSPRKAKPPTRIHADFLFFKTQDDRHLHLFVCHESNNRYAAMSFIPRYQHEQNPEQFVTGQAYTQILKRETLPLGNRKQQHI